MRDLAYDLVANAAKVNYGDLPEDVVEITKKFILDTLGTIIAGSTAAGCPQVARFPKVLPPSSLYLNCDCSM